MPVAMSMPGTPATFRFGEYELDVAAYELRRASRPVRLERRPMDLLILLLESLGRLVSRGDIVDRLWGADVFVDVEMGINTAVRKVRMALRDSRDAPRFLETVAGKGYRFIAEAEDARQALPEGAPSLVRLAVLPFENLGADPERDYLAEGLTEEAIVTLGQIDPEHLAVVGRTSIMAYKRTAKTVADIGGELGASHLIEGSIRADGTRLRITVKLIRVSDLVQVWASSYDREPSDILAFQRELASALAEQIRLRLSPERLTALGRRQTSHAEAYDLYLRGRYFWNQLTPPTTREAIKYYSRATEHDPDYALAWSGLADAHVSSPITGDAPPLEVMPRAREAARQAVRAQPDLAEAQTSLGMVSFWDTWDWRAAEEAYQRAVELDPAYDLAHRMMGVLLAHTGRQEEARDALRRARELEPLNPMHHALSSHAAFLARDYEGALPFARHAIVIDPGFWIGHYLFAQAAERLGDHELALEELGHAARLSGGNSKALALRGYLFAKLGRTGEAREVLTTLESLSRVRFLPPCAMALVHLALGESDRVFECLDRAHATRDIHLVYLAVDPKWDVLREDSRLAALLERCGLPHENVAPKDGARHSRS